MAQYLSNEKTIKENIYNADLTDAKVDFALDELALNKKVTIVTTIVVPIITGVADPGWTVTEGADAPDYADGVTAVDEQEGDITANIVIDASAVVLATAGAYDVTYNVSDLYGNAAIEVVAVVTVTI